MAKQINPLDKWVISTFKVLPSDERFQRLSEEEKLLLYYIFLEAPTTEQEMLSLKRKYYESKNLVVTPQLKEAGAELGIDIESAVETIKRKG